MPSQANPKSRALYGGLNYPSHHSAFMIIILINDENEAFLDV